MKVDIKQLLIILTLTHVLNKEIALFIYGRRGAGHVDPMIIDNVEYSKVVEQQFLPLLQSNLFNIIPDVLYEQFGNKFCTTLYKIDRARKYEYEVGYTVENRIVSVNTLFDQTINEIDAYQLIPKVQPILDNRGQNIDNRYTLIFDGSKRIRSNININVPIVTVFIGGAKVQVTGHRSQVTGYRSQVTGHRLQVTGHRSQVTGHNKIYDEFVFGSYQFISYFILVWYSLFIPTNLFL